MTVTRDDVLAAAARLDGVAVRTPVLRRAHGGGELLLKAESLQRTGSFKFRGAYNHVAALGADAVLTVSSGNHAQALALAASLTGARATVLMPEDAPAGKRAATERLGARVETFDRYATDREALVARVAAERGLAVVHPYDHPLTVAGQGTGALELEQDHGAPDLLVCCCGGGGLAAGWAAALPGAEVVGVEPAERPALRRALAAGAPVDVPVPRTLADGQQTAGVGATGLAVLLARGARGVGVSDAEIAAAVSFAFTELRLVLEPSGASALAAVLAGHVDVRDRRVAVTLSGGNVDPGRFAALVTGRLPA